MMKLYYTPSTCSLAPHIVLQEIGANFDLIKVDLSTKITEFGNDFFQVNQHGSVPALALDNGEILTEGVAIMQYLADKFPEANLAPPNGTFERYRLQERLNYLTSELHKSFYPLFANGTDVEKEKAVIKIESKLDFLDSILADKPYLLGDAFTVADAYLFVLGRWTTPTGIGLDKWPNIVEFSSRIEARESVQKAMKAEGLLG